MERGKPIRRWTVEPAVAPAETPAPAEPVEVPAVLEEHEVELVPA